MISSAPIGRFGLPGIHFGKLGLDVGASNSRSSGWNSSLRFCAARSIVFFAAWWRAVTVCGVLAGEKDAFDAQAVFSLSSSLTERNRGPRTVRYDIEFLLVQRVFP